MNVSIDRTNCTSCRTCWETCPEFFEESPDDLFSRVIEKFRTHGNPGEGAVPAELESCVKDAADLCPAQIIAIEKS
jgi:ferredoxin